jgi:ADP-ribose pyrophosphatase
MAIIEREVEFARAKSVKSTTRSASRITLPSSQRCRTAAFPLSGKYRPALESFTWEFPAGLVEPGEDAPACCRREFMEETGFAARAVHALGSAGC